MSIKGFDVASFQHPGDAPINFEKAKAAGYEFVYVKATEGVGYVNPFFVRDVHAAHKAGLAVGAYTFVRPSVDAVAAANKLHEVIKSTGVRLDLPVGLDLEKTDGCAPHLVHDRLDQLRTVLRQHGYRTLTYSYASFLLQNVAHGCKFCASDPLWLADYDAKQPSAPAPWSKVTIWQKYDKASVPGVLSAAEDGDLFLGNQAAFDVFIGRRRPAVELPAWYHRLLQFPPTKLRHPGYTVLRNGVRFQEGDDVKAVQRKLGIRVDGLYGEVTANHVKGFQRLHGLTQDGVVGPDTAKRLG